MARTPKPPARSQPVHRRRRTAGVVGTLVGLAAAGTAAGVALSRIAARRVRAAQLGEAGGLTATPAAVPAAASPARAPRMPTLRALGALGRRTADADRDFGTGFGDRAIRRPLPSRRSGG